MIPALYAHPFSSYCQKVLTALYENGTEFEYRLLSGEEPQNITDWHERWPIRRFPILVDGDREIVEATTVIEYLDLHYPGKNRLIPEDPDAAIDVRMMDRFFDNYISTPQQKFVFNQIRPEADRDPYGVHEARDMLDRAYGWLDTRMRVRIWASGEDFSLADCAAAPALFYADWCHPIDPGFEHAIAYRKRLLARPSFARAVDEARPFRQYFPLGAPDRD